MPLVFTPEEANAALALVRPLAERMARHAEALAAAQSRREELGRQIGGNGGDLTAGEVRSAAADVQREVGALRACVAALEAHGVHVKDARSGLVDFPARHDGRDVLLCWRLGEDEVAYWHGIEEGFAGRKPLPFPDR